MRLGIYSIWYPCIFNSPNEIKDEKDTFLLWMLLFGIDITSLPSSDIMFLLIAEGFFA